jgi:hypothetical protein
LPLQELAKEPFGRVGISMFLNEDVDLFPILVHGPPEIVPLALDLHEDFIQVPHVSQTTLVMSKHPRVLRPELPTPLPNSLVGDDNPALRQEFLDVAEAQGESVVQLDTVADDLRRKPVAMIAVRIRFHQRSLEGTGSS